MKHAHIATILLCALTFGACTSTPPDNSWKLVWEDDFNSGILDTTVWSRTTRGGSDWQNTQSDDPRCMTFRDGCVVFRGIVNDNPEDPAPHLTGGIWTKDKKCFGPGRIEVRARLHACRGAWPAIWAFKYNPADIYSEIDLMERLNGDSIAYQTLHSEYTLHVNTQSPHGGTGPIDPDDFNVYGADVESDSIVLHINGIPTFTYYRDSTLTAQGQYPYECGHFLLLDMQLGGAWVGEVANEDLPVEMEVDWVRFYQR